MKGIILAGGSGTPIATPLVKNGYGAYLLKLIK